MDKQIEILDMIQEAQKTMRNCSAEPKCVFMHPSTAEKLIEQFFGLKCNIEYSCPKGKIFLMQNDPRNRGENG